MRSSDESLPQYSVDSSRPLISDRMIKIQDDDSINGRVIVTVDRDGPSSNGHDPKSFFIKTILRDEEQVRGFSSNSPSLGHHSTRRFFPYNRNSFLLLLNI